MELRDRCYLQIEKTIEDVFSVQNIKTYLDIVANCSNMSFLNHLLIFRQYPNATDIAGIQAWEMRGRKVKKETVPIALLYPKIAVKSNGEPYTDEYNNPLCEMGTNTALYKIDPSYEADYTVVYAFDYMQTLGSTPSIPHKTGDFVNRIRQLTDFVIMTVPEQDIQVPGEKGFYSIIEKEFQIQEGLSDEDRDRTLLSLYVQHCYCELIENKIDVDYYYTKIETQLTKYCVLKYFDLSEKQPSFIYVNKLTSVPSEIKKKILYTISHMTSKIIKDMVGYYLDFDETAIVNCILETPTYKDLVAIAEKIRPYIVDESIYNTVTKLIEKLLRTKHTYLEKLHADREQKKLYTYPARLLDMEEI